MPRKTSPRNPHPPHRHHERGCLVKRRGHTERYDERKAYAACYAAALATQLHAQDAEKLSAAVSKELTAWMRKQKRCVPSDEIFQQLVSLLRKRDPNVAFMFASHRDVS